MPRFLLTYVLCFAAFGGIAQLSIGHEQVLHPLHELNVQTMPTVDNENLLNIEYRNHQNDRPVHFAHPFSVAINPSQSGDWEYVDDMAIWRVIVESKTAHSINLGFSEFYLPQDGYLYVYDYHLPEKTNSFTRADNEEHEQLWTPIITSDKIVVELNIPVSKINELKLQLSYVNHDFLDIRKSSSESCLIDVNCAAENGYPEIEEFRNQIRSVGLFTLSGVSICSGFLINNTRQDCTPYFLTAFHCNLNQSNAASMVTYWNYENSECRAVGSQANTSQGNGAFDTFSSGAIWRAGWVESDFTLVELDDEVPEAAEAYFAGWDINNNPPDRAVLIHHPNLEEKRISFADGNLFTGKWGLETKPIVNGNHLVLDHWDQGSTESGSSGAPLFNRQGLVVGQLHGGLASCDNQEYDAFGRLFSSWTGGNSSSSRLKDWLDPDGTGRVQLPGKNCVFEIKLSENNVMRCGTDGFFMIDVQVDDSFLGQVDMTFEGLPNGASAFFSTQTVFAGQTTILTVANINNLTDGSYSVDIIADNGQTRKQERLYFEIFTQVPDQANLLSPEPNAVVNMQDISFEWLPQTMATSYEFQLSENENLVPILLESATKETNLSVNFPLLANENYYWRVRATNTCGTSSWSPVFSFYTVDLTCNELTNTTPQTIDSNETSILTSVIQNELRGIVQSVAIKNITGKHNFVSDLRFSLFSPAGTEVILMSRKCSSNQDFNIGFSDNGISQIICPPTNGQLYMSETPLANFIGESAHGDWTLKVEDVNKFDGGVLNGWTIEICTNPSMDYSISADVDSLKICANESMKIPFGLGAGYDASADIVFENSHDALCSIEYMNGQGHLIMNPNEFAMPGSYPIEIKVNDESGNVSFLELFLLVMDAPSAVELLQPSHNATQVHLMPSFSWSWSDFSESYLFELAAEDTFTDLKLAESLKQNEFTLIEPLDAGEVYYWRIGASNRCGETLSQTGIFTTESTNSTTGSISIPIEVFPNPTQDVLYVLLPDNILTEEVSVSLSTIRGKRLIQDKRFSSLGRIALDVQNLPAGIYILSTQIGVETQFNKVVIQ